MTVELRRKADVLLGEYQHARRVCQEEKDRLRETEAAVASWGEAQKAAQQVAETIQNEAHAKIASVVTSCIRSVFDDGSELKVEFKSARGKTEARLVFVKDGNEESPLEASSGGKVDLASFALRLVCIMLSRPRRRKLLVLDEPLRNLNGSEIRNKARMLLEEMAKKMGFQIIVSTGFDWLRCGKVIDLEEIGKFPLQRERHPVPSS